MAAGFFGGALVVEVDKALQDGLFEVFVAAGEAVGERESGTIRPGRVRLEGGPVEGIMTGTVMPLVGFEDDGIEVVVDLLEEGEFGVGGLPGFAWGSPAARQGRECGFQLAFREVGEGEGFEAAGFVSMRKEYAKKGVID